MFSRLFCRNLNLVSKNCSSIQKLSYQNYSSSSKKKDQPNLPEDDNLTLGNFGTKYQVFKDDDSEIVLDVDEEREKYASKLLDEELEVYNPFEGLNLNRGVNGVFEIEDLVAVLKRENASKIFVAQVPSKYQYVDYICVANANSQRHLKAIAQFVKRVYKHKRGKHDIVPRTEGAGSSEWIAIDLGNIALHIFDSETRKVYDIDSLWAVGPEYDKESLKEDPVVEMLEKHVIYLNDLQPAK